MANILKDFVVEDSTTTGTGSLTLNGPINNMKRFSDVCSVGNSVRYIIKGVSTSGIPTGEWEVVEGEYSAANTLTRVTVVASSNANALVNFSSGPKQVYIGPDATMLSWVREKVTAARTYYVRTDGSDSNNGLANTSSGAFLTIQKASDVISSSLDIASGVTVTVQVADGTYTTPVVLRKIFGAGDVTIRGNNTTPGNVVISTTSADCFACYGESWTVLDMKLTTTTSGWGISSLSGGIIRFGNIDFGAAATGHIIAAFAGQAFSVGNYTISGGGVAHFYLDRFGYIEVSGKTITITGTPAFSTSFVRCTGLSEVYSDACTFSGSATGKRYDVAQNGVLFTGGGGANYFPGNSAGTTATGGQYI